MTSVQELIEAASQPSIPLADLLRKAKVVAARTGDQGMIDWTTKELDGYEDDALPAYRGPFRGDARADFYGRGGVFKDTPIDPQGLPDFVRESDLFLIRLNDGVTELEDLLDPRNHRGETRGIGMPWPVASVSIINEMLRAGMSPRYAGMNLVEAWTPISPSLVRSVLDTVRNRVLDYALSLESSGGRAPTKSSTSDPAITNHTTIHAAPGANIAIGSVHVRQSNGLPAPSTHAELLSQLREIGLSDDLLNELRDALTEDQRDAGSELIEPGKQVNQWLGKVAVLSAKAGGGIGIAGAGGVVTQLVLQYFGLLSH